MSSKPSDKYPTSSTAKCLIGGYWIDDVHRIEYKEINGKVPLQGWNQKYIADVADGQCMIQGALTIFYRYPKYLLAAIKEATKKMDVPTTDAKEKSRVVDAINFLRSGSPEDRVKFLANANADQFRLYSELLDVAFSGEINTFASSPVTMAPSETPGGFNMRVIYYDGMMPYYAENLVGVYMTGRQKVLSAGTGGGDMGGSGMPLYETYSFFARKLEESDFKDLDQQLRKLSEIATGAANVEIF